MNQNNDEQPNAGMQLLASVRYFLSSSLPQDRQDDLRQVLGSNGATAAAKLKDATHIITNSHRFEGSGEVEAGVNVVTDQWVDRSLVLGKMQQPQFYSPDPAMIFSGVVACAAELPTSDLEVLSAGITGLGGQWRTGLTKDVTHLFAITPNSQKYATALHFQELTQVKVVLPHWFDDAVRLGMGGLSIAPYEWPDPPLLKGKHGVNYGAKKDDGTEQDEAKKSLYATAVMYTPAHGSSPPIRPPSPGGMDMDNNTHLNNVWGGRRILLSRTLRLFAGRRDAVEVGIRRSGGEIVRYAGDDEEDEEDPDEEIQEQKEWEMDRKEADVLKECDILVTRWRSGRPYVRAFRNGKTIGTLAWVFHVQSTGILSRPLDQLLHYPVPKKPIENFSLHEITVTNYTGEAREYLKKLITAMGATFTPSMTGKNTVLIAAFLSGTKATKALSWSIPVVNHTWLEDCFVQWRNLTVGVEKYIVFPPGVDFSTHLGERGVGVGRGIEEEVKEMGDDDDEGGEAVQEAEGPRGTDASMREVQGLVDGDVHMVDEESKEHYGMDVDGPAPGEDFRFDEDEDEEEEMHRPEVKSKPNGALSSVKKVPATSSPSKPSSSTAKLITRKSPVKLVPVAIPPKTPTKNKAKAKELEPELSPLSPVKSVVRSPVKSPVKSAPASPAKAAQVKSKSGPSSKKAVRTHEEDEDEESEEEEAVIHVKSKPGLTSKKKPSTRTHEEEQEEEEEDEEKVTPAVKPKSKAAASSKSKPGPSSKRAPARSNEEDEEEVEVTAPAIKSKSKLGSSSKGKSTRTQDAEDDEEEEEEERVSAAKSRSGSSSKRKPFQTGEEDEDEVQITPARKKASRAVVSDVSDQDASEEEEIVKPAKKPTKSVATTSSSAKKPVATTSSSAKKSVTATLSSAKPKVSGKAATAKKAPPSEESDEEQKMDVDEDDDDSDIVLVEEVKHRKKLVKRVTRDAEEGDINGSATKSSSILKTTKGDARTRVKKKKVDERKSKTKATETDEEQQTEEEEEEEEGAPKKKEKPKSKAAPPKKPTSTKRTKITPVQYNPDSDEPPVGKLKKLEVHADEDSDADLPAPPPKRKAAAKDGLASGSTTKARTTVIPEENNVKTKEKNVKVNGKAKAKEPDSSGEEEVEEEVQEEEEEEEERLKVKKAVLKRTESIKAAARERGHDSPSRAPTSKAKATPNAEGSTSKQQSSVKNKGTPATSTSAKAKPQPKVKKAPVPTEEATPTPSISTAPPRRNAATKATQKLRDVIMPDMNNFEQQMKKSRKSGGGVNGMGWDDGGTRESSVGKKRRRASEVGSDRMDVDGEQEEEEEENVVREKKRVKLSAGPVGKGKGKERAVSSDDEEEEEQSRKSPVKGKGKSKRKQAEPEDDEDATPPPVTVSKGTKSKKAEEVDNDPSSKSSSKKPVRVMTTQVTLGDDVIKALTKLGVKMTTRPSECTHLLAAQLVRTEKFLCALSGSPFILTDKWATASAAAKKLLPEKDFILRDKAGEKKYNVNLAKSLKQAKESGGKLLEGKTFYITPRIKIDVKLLRNVIIANGGQVGNSAPTARILGANPDRYIISCVEDISIWRPIYSQNFPIYTQELVLNGALRQEVEFDNDEYRVEGSF
ncbi:hypothetical protein K443DRAFT_684887 [Laccaria amethystina LaAM-08-1]|uniref:BRCT domain-containing protein n=1 Tax=Laccaria amethystina LaAM-08-1 TaxID=1095629 RepID=A0A0C9WIH6_9AGAR|nr:hypothetical protein K443DRAFT_684887 [Laccaria amethystina LaAM-08-1]